MFSESVLAGLPSRQSFRVILLLEPFQLMSKFRRNRLYILKWSCLSVNILKILVPICYSPKAFLSNRGTGLLSTSMLKASVFPDYKNMITIIWFCIVLTANTCSLHENQHYHVWSSMVYVKPAMTSTLLLTLAAIIFTPNNVKAISIFIVILH